MGKPVIAPIEISSLKYDYILVASVYWKEMRQQLLELGIEEKR